MPTSHHSFSHEHRIALSVVAGATVVMLSFSFLSIGKMIRAPFEIKTTERFRTIEEREREAVAALKVKDTDGDGLTDYEEIELYQTSAYLIDTDGDADEDGAEVASGEDPNCPKGRTCQNAAVASPSGRNDPSGLLFGARANPFLGAGAAGTPGTFDSSILQTFDASKIRTLLKSSGLSEDQLSRITDEELQKLYEETLNEQVPTSTRARVENEGTP